MIPAQHPYQARLQASYTDAKGQVHTYFETKPVVAWDDDGAALVVGRKGLVRAADEFSNFEDVVEAPSPIVAVIPGGGWTAEYANGDGTTFTSPILAWSIDTEGDARPVSSDSDGISGDVTAAANFNGLCAPGWEPKMDATAKRSLTIPDSLDTWPHPELTAWLSQLNDDPTVSDADYERAARAVTACLLGEDIAATIHNRTRP